jgi:ribonuclease HI
MIEIFVDSRNFGESGSGFGVILKYGAVEWKRGIPCGKITSNQAELKALLFGLLSIKEDFRNERIVIYTKNKYATLMLSKTDGNWLKELGTIEKNRELIGEVRQQIDKFKEVEIRIDMSNPILMKSRDITEEVMRTGKEIQISPLS